jgi:hypothetical protein
MKNKQHYPRSVVLKPEKRQLTALYVLAFSDWPAFRNKHTATA